MVKYEWDESNGVSVPTNKLMAIDADEYYVGMPLKKVDAETVAPTDGDPEYICLAQRNAGDEIRPLQIPVQEVFPDAVYTKIMEDGTEEKVKFGGGGEPDWNASEGEDGYIKNRTHYDRVIVHDSVTEVIRQSTTVPNGYGTLPNFTIDRRKPEFPEGKYILIRLGGEELKLTALPPKSGSLYTENITLKNGVIIQTHLTAVDPVSGMTSARSYYYCVRPVYNEATDPYIGQEYSVSLCEYELKQLDPKFLPKITIVQDGYDDAAMGVMATIAAAYTCTANATFLDVMQMLMAKTLPPIELYAFDERGLCHYYGGSVTLVMGDSEPYLSISFFNTTGYGTGYKGVSWYYGDEIVVGDY